MTYRKLFILSVTAVLALLLSACGADTTTTGSSTDAQAAQAFLPPAEGALSNYTVTEADSITDALTAAAGQGADVLGNEVIEQAVTRIDGFIQCYNDVGAVAANIYTPTDLSGILQGDLVPSVGAVAVVNQDRVRENLLACATGGSADTFSAQQAPTTCQGSGTFTSGDDTLTYIYISTNTGFCDAVTGHFSQYGG